MSNVGAKSKHCDFTLALSNIDQSERLISELPEFPFWAYIKHQPDSENGSIHYHFYIHLKQPLSIQSLSEKLDIPTFMIEWVRMKTKVIQYLIHKNNPDKIQYKEEDIITNNRELLNSFLFPEKNSINIYSEFKDLFDVSSGFISVNSYLDKYSNYISSLSFYSRQTFLIRLISLIEERSERDIHIT